MCVKDHVERVLERDERARNNDKWLIIEVLRDMGYTIYIDYTKLDTMPAFESITRARRKFNEEGKYWASDKVLAFRDKEEYEMRRLMRSC